MFSCLVGERELGCNWELGFLRVFLYTIVSPYFIVKSLQFRGRRQSAEPRKYCLMRVIVFLWRVFSLFFFCFSQVGILVKFAIAATPPPMAAEVEKEGGDGNA